MAIYNCFSSTIYGPTASLRLVQKNEFYDVDLSQVTILTTATINMLRLQPPPLYKSLGSLNHTAQRTIAHVLQMDTFFGELSFLVYCI